MSVQSLQQACAWLVCCSSDFELTYGSVHRRSGKGGGDWVLASLLCCWVAAVCKRLCCLAINHTAPVIALHRPGSMDTSLSQYHHSIHCTAVQELLHAAFAKIFSRTFPRLLLLTSASTVDLFGALVDSPP